MIACRTDLASITIGVVDIITIDMMTKDHDAIKTTIHHISISTITRVGKSNRTTDRRLIVRDSDEHAIIMCFQ